MLEVSNLYRSYNHNEDFALNDVHLTIYEHEHIVLFGKTDSGKSCLLKTIHALEPIDSGEIHIKGQTLNKKQPTAYLSEEICLFPHLTVLDNFALVGNKQQTFDSIQMLELDPHEIFDCFPQELSPLEQIKLCYARMLCTQPEIILLDNPFKQFDQNTQLELLELIKKIHQKLPATILFATDDLTLAKQLSTQVIILDEGRIQENIS